VTVGRFDAGTRPTSSPDAPLEGTFARREAVRDHIVLAHRAFDRWALHNARLIMTLEGTPGGQPERWRRLPGRRRSPRGEANAVPCTPPTWGRGFRLLHGRSRLLRLPRRPRPDARGFRHSSKFEFDEDVLPIGARYFYEVARSRRIRRQPVGRSPAPPRSSTCPSRQT
jgi:hypothetical protein